MTELLLTGSLCGIVVGALLLAEGGLLRLLRLSDLGVALTYTVVTLALGLGLVLLAGGCASAPTDVQVASFGGEAHVELVTDTLGPIAVRLDNIALNTAPPGEPAALVYCPVLELTIATMTWRGVPIVGMDVSVQPDAACAKAFGTFGLVRTHAQAFEAEPSTPAD